jgi:hypothetical protein
MTAPSVRGWAAATNTTDALPARAITLPTRVAGDLLLCFCAGDFTSAVTPTGTWTELSDEAGSANRLAIYARIATNDANDNLSLAGANNQDFSANVVAITTGTHGVTDVATQIICSAAAATADTGNANPPSQGGGSSKDWLAFAACAIDVTAAGQIPTAYPANYSAGVLQQSGNIAGSVNLGVGQRQLTATQTEDPGTFTNTSNPWVAKTVLVPPAAATVEATGLGEWGGLTGQANADVVHYLTGAYWGMQLAISDGQLPDNTFWEPFTQSDGDASGWTYTSATHPRVISNKLSTNNFTTYEGLYKPLGFTIPGDFEIVFDGNAPLITGSGGVHVGIMETSGGVPTGDGYSCFISNAYHAHRWIDGVQGYFMNFSRPGEGSAGMRQDLVRLTYTASNNTFRLYANGVQQGNDVVDNTYDPSAWSEVGVFISMGNIESPDLETTVDSIMIARGIGNQYPPV